MFTMTWNKYVNYQRFLYHLYVIRQVFNSLVSLSVSFICQKQPMVIFQHMQQCLLFKPSKQPFISIHFLFIYSSLFCFALKLISSDWRICLIHLFSVHTEAVVVVAIFTIIVKWCLFQSCYTSNTYSSVCRICVAIFPRHKPWKQP